MHSLIYSSVISTNKDDRKINSRLDASSKLGNTMILIPNSNYHKKVDSVVVSMSHHLASPTQSSSNKVYGSLHKNSLNNSKFNKNDFP
jgi:hypothetical protein